MVLDWDPCCPQGSQLSGDYWRLGLAARAASPSLIHLVQSASMLRLGSGAGEWGLGPAEPGEWGWAQRPFTAGLTEGSQELQGEAALAWPRNSTRVRWIRSALHPSPGSVLRIAVLWAPWQSVSLRTVRSPGSFKLVLNHCPFPWKLGGTAHIS